MGWNTKIAWAHDTFNPWWGCTEVSPGCDHCYARTAAHRYGHAVWGQDAPRRFFTDKHWDLPFRWHRAAEKSGVRRRVFCASMADILEERPDEMGAAMSKDRQRLWFTIANTSSLDWLLLSKRATYRRLVPPEILAMSNVWPGVTVESADYLWRVQALLELTCAGPRWVSYEPALGPVDFTPFVPTVSYTSCQNRADAATQAALRALAVAAARHRNNWRGLEWVVVGGESGFLPPLGHDAPRPFDLAWARGALAVCRQSGTAFFMKQLGAQPVNAGVSLAKRGKMDDPGEWPEDLRVQEFPR